MMELQTKYHSVYASVPYNFSYRCWGERSWRHNLSWLTQEVNLLKAQDLSRIIAAYYSSEPRPPAETFVDALSPFQLLSKTLSSFMAFRLLAHASQREGAEVAVYFGSWLGQLPLIDRLRYDSYILIDKDPLAIEASKQVLRGANLVDGVTRYRCMDVTDWSLEQEQQEYSSNANYHFIVTGAEHFDPQVLQDKFKDTPVGTRFTVLSTNAAAEGHIAKCDSSHHLQEQFARPWFKVHEEAVITVPWASRFGITLEKV